MKNYLQKKIILLITILATSASAWDSNIKVGCINENLDPCSNLDLVPDNSKEETALSLNKQAIQKENKKTYKNANSKKLITNDVLMNQNVKETLSKKETVDTIKLNKDLNKIEKINLVKKNNKKKIIKNLSISSDSNYNFEKDMSFNDFKALIINYTNKSDYPNLNN